jgi:glycosyltransferase involved in cell wall biosynthesis
MNPSAPRVSFIVLSYNYRHYIGQTIESILTQTERNIELIVVDDGSSDGSASFVRSIADPRVVLIENENNIGACLSFAKAFSVSRGEFIANVDSDDWIEPERTALQLAMFDRESTLDVVGTWVRFVNADGLPHKEAIHLEEAINCDLPLNNLESWVVQNRLCRSSTMLRRAVHEKDGLYDLDMTYAPDFELWTRLLLNGRKFALLQQPLTNYRLHDSNLTHANAQGTLIEIAYLMQRNVIPLGFGRGIPSVVPEILNYLVASNAFALLTARQRLRLLGLVFAHERLESFATFRNALFGPRDARLERGGANFLAMTEQNLEAEHRLHRDMSMYIEARDWWRAQAEANAEARDWWRAQAEAISEARDWWKEKSETGQASDRLVRNLSRLKRSKLYRFIEKWVPRFTKSQK